MYIFPIFIPYMGCPFQCVYCNQRLITKTSDLKIDISKVKEFVKYHANESKEIAFFGGTFTNLSINDQKHLLDTVNKEIDNKTTIRISTKPDCINDKILEFLKSKNVKTIELGIQSFSDTALKASRRGYTSEIAQAACRQILKAGFKLGIQLMPGLPGSTRLSDAESIETSILIKPDYVRLYPTIVLKNTALEKLYNNGKYKALELEYTLDFLADAIESFNQHEIKVIKTGLHSDIDKADIIAGPYHQTMGELVQAQILLKKIIADFEANKTLVYAVGDESLFKGFKRSMINKLKSKLNIDKLKVKATSEIPRGSFLFKNIVASEIW